MMEAIDDLLQNLVRLGADDQVASAEDVRGNRIDADRGCNAAIFIDHVRVAVLLEGGPEIAGLQSNARADSNEVFHILQLPTASPVSLEQRVVHLVESAALAGELGRAQRTAGIDDHVAMPQLQPGLGRHRSEVLLPPLQPPAPEIDLSRNALHRRLRMEPERQRRPRY